MVFAAHSVVLQWVCLVKNGGGLGGVSFISQLIGTALAIGIALAGGFIVYGLLKATIGIRLSQEDEFRGADLSIHKISANSEEGMF